VVPSVQKKTGPVAGDVKSEDVDDDASPDEDEGDQKPNKKRAPGAKAATKKEHHTSKPKLLPDQQRKAVVGRMTIRQIRRMTR
jgi:hypothetical protein